MTTKTETKTVTKNETKPTKAPATPKITPEMQALIDIKAILQTGVNSAVRRWHFEDIIEANKVTLPEA